eukprot:TRINITY_DN48232_c0_g1_i1.p3 TRINITY_DN48232_c0_g1~~TRINITY_DN48232_c0_g1_i1.p3  ORF type:complete len:232 (-),score=61.26 TRINITY_DN48232_c0_g1_i1:2288-2983(-)
MQSDPYYRRAKALGYRARSAFKLQQLDEQYALLRPAVAHVLDLCAAPGSWSQYVAHRLQSRDHAKILSVDLQQMAPIKHVCIMQMDITQPRSAHRINAFFGAAGVHLVLCDGAPDVTGLHGVDEYVHSHLLRCAIRIATLVMNERATFVAKVFRRDQLTLLTAQLALLFENVRFVKPASSRSSSGEAFVLCTHFKRVRLLEAHPHRPHHDGVQRFVNNGDLSALDFSLPST